MRRFIATLLNCYIVLLLLAPGKVLAANELLPVGQIIESDFLRAGDTVQIDGEIRGDAFLAGGIVTVNGKIDGDLFVLGGKVTVNGPVGNSVRVMGGDVTVNSEIGRNALLICGNCNVARQSKIDGSLIVAGANTELAATKIGKGFRFFGSRLYLNSEINNEAFVVADREFLLGPYASISGNLKYTGTSEVIKQIGATVAGTIDYQKNNKEAGYPKFFGARTMLASYEKVKPLTYVLGFAVTALIGFLLLGLFPKIFEKTVVAMENRPAASFGWGLAIALGLPVIAVLFAMTIVGIPVSLVLLLIGYLCWLFAQYLTAFFLGRKIMLPKFGERRGWAILLGLLLIWILGAIPVLGSLVKAALVIFSLGAAVLAYKQPEIVKPQSLGEHRYGRKSR